MATAPKTPLRAITAEERAILVRITRASSERLDRVRRARALLAVADGHSFAAAGRQAGFRSGGSVTDLVRRFNGQGMAALTIAAGRGRQPTYDGSARAQIVRVAQAPPDRRADQTATWSLATLRRRLRRDGGCGGKDSRPWGRARSGGSCRKQAVRTNAVAPGVRPARRNGCGRAEWSR